jgi:predicted TIM-barrel fold metal-dependent hydrolase
VITDAQILVWEPDSSSRPWPKEDRGEPHKAGGFSSEQALLEMTRAGVDRAILVPPSWAGDDNEVVLEAAARHAGRFAVMGRFDPTANDARSSLARWRENPYMLGVRITFHTERFRNWLAGDELEWFWKSAEELRIPVATHAGHGPERHAVSSLFADIARRHPELRIIIDHMNRRHIRGPQVWEDLNDLLSLASQPNVSVKLTCVPAYSADPYPYKDTHEALKRIYDMFGAHRLLWGSDLTRLRVPYVDCLKLFEEELKFISPEDRKWILGATAATVLAWPE